MIGRRLVALAVGVFVVQVAASAVVATQIDLAEQVPIHWGIDGTPDGYGPAWLALAFGPALTLVLAGVFAVMPYIDPRRRNLERSLTAYRGIGGAIIVFGGGVHALVLLATLDSGIDVARFISVGIGLLFMVIGNFLGKLRSSWFVGIRTPWTLSSEHAWARTHRLGGYLFVTFGIALAIGGAFLPLPAVATVAGVGAVALVAVLFVYSFLAWRDDPDRRVRER